MDIFAELGNIVDVVGSALQNAFTAVSGIFYNSTTSTVTLVGYLLIAILGVGFIKMALNLIVRLFSRIK